MPTRKRLICRLGIHRMGRNNQSAWWCRWCDKQGKWGGWNDPTGLQR